MYPAIQNFSAPFTLHIVPFIFSPALRTLNLKPFYYFFRVKKDAPHILLVNPWIHDFAAYDFWAKPMGLLLLAAILRQHGALVSYLDCLDRFHPRAPRKIRDLRYGRGPYLKSPIRKPAGLGDVPRNYSRYGIRPEWLRQDLLSLKRPDLICVTSLMTYWYPGVQETIAMIKAVFPGVEIWLGGIYASLCETHALENSGADRVVSGSDESEILKLISDKTGFDMPLRFSIKDLDTYPYPAFDLQRNINYLPLMTSRGCPFSCAYCASHILQPVRRLRDPFAVTEEIRFWQASHQVNNFVFYDDALLTDKENHAIPMLEGIVQAGLKVNFHTPNALHVRGIDRTVARLMFEAGFKTLRLGLETTDFVDRKDIDRKVTSEEFLQAVGHLKAAGFRKEQVGAYLLVGLPGQDIRSVEASIRTVRKSGITPVPAYYSPIPHTAMWRKAVVASRYDLDKDPVFTNNAILPCRPEPFSWDMVSALKNLASAGPGSLCENRSGVSVFDK